MTYSEAQKIISDMDAGRIPWDDNLRSPAQDVLSGKAYGLSDGGADYTKIAQDMIKMQQEANKPAVASLEASVPEVSAKYASERERQLAEREPLMARYDRLLKDITKYTEIASAREFGRRGIPLSSGVYESTLAERIEPQTERIGLEREAGLKGINDLVAEMTSKEIEELRNIRNAIAQLQAGGASTAITNALQIYQAQKQQELQLKQMNLQRMLAEQQIQAQKDIASQQQSWQERMYKEYGGGSMISSSLQDLWNRS